MSDAYRPTWGGLAIVESPFVPEGSIIAMPDRLVFSRFPERRPWRLRGGNKRAIRRWETANRGWYRRLFATATNVGD